MSLRYQLQKVQLNSANWLLGIFLCSLFIAEAFGVLEKINAPIYSTYMQISTNGTKQTNLVIIESDSLTKEHLQLVDKVVNLEARAVVVFMDQTLSTNPSKSQHIFYTGARTGSCDNEITTWLGYDIVYSLPTKDACQKWFKALFPNVKSRHHQLINFSLPVSTLPKFSAQRLLTDDIFLAQIKNKIVFITQRTPNYTPSLRAPGLQDEKNPVLLYAYLAHNLEQNLLITPLNTLASALVQLAAALVLILIYQRYGATFNITIALVLNMLVLIVGYIAIYYLQALLPVGQLLLVIWTALAWAFFHSKSKEEQSLKKLLSDSEQRMFGRYLPKSIFEQATPWDAVITLTNQLLSLHKGIFLTRVEHDHRLREIHAINCQIDDIKELRRDYERPPYSDAIKALGVIKISSPFFANLNENESQYIVPLMYAGDIRGFWAMTILNSDGFNEQAFMRNVNRFASQVGELLYHHHTHSNLIRDNSHTLIRTLTLDVYEPLSKKVHTSIAGMEQKLLTLEHLFNRLSTASVMFNLFGQVMQVNKAFEQLAAQQKLLIFDLTALDLLMMVGNLPIDVARGKLRYLTLNKGQFSLSVSLGEQHYIMVVCSLDKLTELTQSASPFSISGVLFEFINVSALFDKLDSPDKMIERLAQGNQHAPPQNDDWGTP
ncbi:hypothetical protein [Pseudoalteromonas amylolytica]|uniref:CHASE2 domain-containing protein n=2 Tax=Pseudoalteromonas TaxID=53246 RepID=A0A1S1MYV3_9GAMM|nr:hypothetical protein [Pseudoalteromonas amylolytica]OHU89307.1 hypothetical protein BFC16_06665 [Pseudoalteromonas sp. JW3]OHU92207.1 hypothetical protein BET10_07770 [Pseudoalteromonas amylolytica]